MSLVNIYLQILSKTSRMWHQNIWQKHWQVMSWLASSRKLIGTFWTNWSRKQRSSHSERYTFVANCCMVLQIRKSKPTTLLWASFQTSMDVYSKQMRKIIRLVSGVGIPTHILLNKGLLTKTTRPVVNLINILLS